MGRRWMPESEVFFHWWEVWWVVGLVVVWWVAGGIRNGFLVGVCG